MRFVLGFRWKVIDKKNVDLLDPANRGRQVLFFEVTPIIHEIF